MNKTSGRPVSCDADQVDGGLTSQDGQPLAWFTGAGAGGKFVPADVRIAGETLEVSAAEFERSVVVRFARSKIAQPNFCDYARLPAEPFRTDEPAR